MYHIRSTITGSSDVMCLQISHDDTLVAAACADGMVRCYSTRSGKDCYDMDTMRAQALKVPATCLRFRPDYVGSRTKNMAVVGTAAGTIEHWHMPTQRCVHSVNLNTEVYCLDYREDGLQFAASGKSGSVYVFDEENKTTPLSTLTWAESSKDRDMPAPAHSSRVQSVKWLPHNPNLLVSGGWDKTIQLWDTRVDHAVSSFYGPYICGDAIVATRDARRLVTASCRDQDQVQVWDLAEPSKPVETLTLHSSTAPCHFYTAALSSNSTLAVGGTTDLLLYSKLASNAVPQALFPEGSHPVFSVCFSSTSSLFACGGAQGAIRLYEPIP
ncbi:putative WD-repeat protein 51A [Diplonema papillatum]|nr:putative WD-repeat protein 51A [Diplonema papillatum]